MNPAHYWTHLAIGGLLGLCLGQNLAMLVSAESPSESAWHAVVAVCLLAGIGLNMALQFRMIPSSKGEVE